MNETGRTFRHVTVLSVHDGDTITVEIDHGFRLRQVVQVRLARINAPEVRGPQKPDGDKSAARLRELLPAGSSVELVTYKNGREKYGRYLASVYKDEIQINDKMVDEGFAVYVRY